MFFGISQFAFLRATSTASAILALCGAVAHAQAGFTFKHEPRAIGSADILGYAIWTAPLGDISINGETIPLRLDFTSDPRPPPLSSPLGRGWSIPFFSSALVEDNQTSLRWHRPDGRIFYFTRERGNQDAKPSKPTDPVEFISTEASWRAVKDPRKRYVVISHVTNGTELFYEDGRLVRFRFAKPEKSAEVYLISYTRTGRPLRLYPLSAGKALVEFDYDTGNIAKSVLIGDSPIALKFADTPLNQFSSGPYLSEVAGSSLMPLTITYQTDGSEVNRVRFRQLADGTGNTGLAWKAVSGFITEDDGASYKIENPSLENAGRVTSDRKKPLVPVDGIIPWNWQPQEAKVTRIDREGKSEFRHFDRDKGVSTTRDKDGVTTIAYFIRAHGALANKLRKIEEIRGGKTIVLERNAYDEKGRILRRIDELGSVTVHEWSQDGDRERIIKDGVLIEEVLYQNGRLLAWKTFSEKGVVIRENKAALADLGIVLGNAFPDFIK